MAERRAQQKYYPPEWDPSKGSINKFRGQHPLRERARKLKEGIMVVRFELPFNIWCEGCDNHIGVGVRFNAEKKKIGAYFSTPIWQFRMKCHLCSSWIEIHTDPENTEYKVVAGARKKVETYEPKDAGVAELKDDHEAEKLATNAFYKLEHDVADVKKAEETLPVLQKLQQRNEKHWDDPFTASQLLRKKLREERKVIKEQERASEALAQRNSISLKILAETEQDRKIAKSTQFSSQKPEHILAKKLKVQSSSIFSGTNQDPKGRLLSKLSYQQQHNKTRIKSTDAKPVETNTNQKQSLVAYASESE